MKLLAGLSLSVLSSLAVAATHTATVPGAGSWTVPPGATEIQLEAIGGAGGKGGSNGDLIPPLPWFQGGHDGYGGAGSGFGLSIGDGPGSGSGGFGGAGSQQSTFGTGGGGGGYGGGGGGTALGTVEDVGGGGAGGSMWLGMQSTTPNAPSCVPALNAGAGAPSFDAPGAAGGDGSLKITWTAAPAPVPTPSVQAVPGLNGLGILLLGLGLTAGGLVRRTGERSH